MEKKIQGYEPKRVLHYFEEISAIPRASGNEGQIADYLERFARQRGLWVYRDAVHNVVIKKRASAGAEGLPPVMLQGHTDMVCEKEPWSAHDFTRDGIELMIDRGFLHANGTTLGADNGIAIALMLALLEEETLCHPALECVFTVQEETGLTGAAELEGGVLQARTMINLDSEEEGVATVSCAGGMRVDLVRRVRREPCAPYVMLLSVGGLCGGHSGMDIGQERAGASKLMGRILYALLQKTALRLIRIDGGSKDNAITRACTAAAAFTTAQDFERAAQIAAGMAAALREEWQEAEPGLEVAIKPGEQEWEGMLSDEDTRAVIEALYLAPHGVRRRNQQAGGFVVSSVNLGIVQTKEGQVRLAFSPRSSVGSLQRETKQELALLAKLFGMEMTIRSEYPGWAYAPRSAIREVFCESYRALFGKELRIEAIHAGLECGLFQSKLPGLDAIAVGPTLYDVHTPNERVDLASCARFWRLLVEVLARLGAGEKR